MGRAVVPVPGQGGRYRSARQVPPGAERGQEGPVTEILPPRPARGKGMLRLSTTGGGAIRPPFHKDEGGIDVRQPVDPSAGGGRAAGRCGGPGAGRRRQAAVHRQGLRRLSRRGRQHAPRRRLSPPGRPERRIRLHPDEGHQVGGASQRAHRRDHEADPGRGLRARDAGPGRLPGHAAAPGRHRSRRRRQEAVHDQDLRRLPRQGRAEAGAEDLSGHRRPGEGVPADPDEGHQVRGPQERRHQRHAAGHAPGDRGRDRAHRRVLSQRQVSPAPLGVQALPNKPSQRRERNEDHHPGRRGRLRGNRRLRHYRPCRAARQAGPGQVGGRQGLPVERRRRRAGRSAAPQARPQERPRRLRGLRRLPPARRLGPDRRHLPAAGRPAQQGHHQAAGRHPRPQPRQPDHVSLRAARPDRRPPGHRRRRRLYRHAEDEPGTRHGRRQGPGARQEALQGQLRPLPRRPRPGRQREVLSAPGGPALQLPGPPVPVDQGRQAPQRQSRHDQADPVDDRARHQGGAGLRQPHQAPGRQDRSQGLEESRLRMIGRRAPGSSGRPIAKTSERLPCRPRFPARRGTCSASSPPLPWR
ncbi:hypothetical protein MTBUT4_80123 [Magnetospirillum sp. UT-4]|nr:hypothetical protein MTBUT4_80123 [Magnetospirillum sp. UT-4]